MDSLNKVQVGSVLDDGIHPNSVLKDIFQNNTDIGSKMDPTNVLKKVRGELTTTNNMPKKPDLGKELIKFHER